MFNDRAEGKIDLKINLNERSNYTATGRVLTVN